MHSDHLIYAINSKLPIWKLIAISCNYIIKFLPLSIAIPLFIGQIAHLSMSDTINLISTTFIAAAIASIAQSNRFLGLGILAPANFSVPFFCSDCFCCPNGWHETRLRYDVCSWVFLTYLDATYSNLQSAFCETVSSNHCHYYGSLAWQPWC